MRWVDGTVLSGWTGAVSVFVSGIWTVDEVVFGEPADLALLGARSLEGLNLRVEPATKRLVDAGPAPAAVAARIAEKLSPTASQEPSIQQVVDRVLTLALEHRMRGLNRSAMIICVIALAACHHPVSTAVMPTSAQPTLAQIYFWRAKPGKVDEYTRYVRDVAAPIDEEARRAGAFISVTTYLASDTLVPWTHMRVFLLRDSAQLRGLGAALNDAGVRVQPDSVKRRQQGEYSATLRDRVGAMVSTIVR